MVIAPGAPLPAPVWDSCPRVRVDASSGSNVADRLHRYWLKRTPVVVELAMTKGELKAPCSSTATPLELGAGFEFVRERLHFLVWANNYDALGKECVWWWDRLAGAEVDGGPRGTLDSCLHRETVEMKRRTLTRMVSCEEELAPDQLAAVTHRGGAARILAPAGSGKTRVLTARIRHLLACGFEPERLTALAYNRRAAEEMRARLPGCKAHIATLHSLGYRLLRSAGNIQVASERQVRSLLESVWQKAPRLNQDPWQPYLEALGQIRLGLLPPEVVEKARTDVPGLAEGYPVFRKRLQDRGWIDHDEQIYGALEVLLRDPHARKAAQFQCTHLLVDEFQDLTPAFLLFVRLLSSPAYQVFGVGDDDQVIYGYAGASPEFLIHYDRYFPGAGSYLLETNYRCPAAVVQAANHLLSHNRVRVAKTARPGPAAVLEGAGVQLGPPEEWSQLALRKVQEWLLEARPEQIAILARVNALLMPVQLTLRAAGVSHQEVVDSSMLGRTGIRTALAYLRVALNPKNASADDLGECLRRPSRMLRRDFLEQCARVGEVRKLLRLPCEPWAHEKLQEFVSEIGLLEKAAAVSSARFFRILRTRTGLGDALNLLDQGKLVGSSHLDDIVALEQAGHLHPDARTFQRWLEGELGGSTSSAGGVRLSSIHRVKGLEWDYVIVYGLQTGLLPHRLCDDPEEERRVCHVAVTRGRREVYLLGAADTTVSPFVAEMLRGPSPKKPKKKRKKRR